MSDHIAVMRAGRIEQVGTHRTLYEEPATGSWPTSSARPT
jgi:ABC-type Fe3+/spermidine/putrescine transport system ATPase subunit